MDYNSLKPSKKAFVIVPRGVLERSKDKPLRNFISEECIVNGIIYLPSKTFYSTLKKTYILAITKKENNTHEERKSKIQTDPIFSYIVKDIGETLDDNRLSKEENDLPNMVSLFNQFKGAKTTFDPDDDKCKIIPISLLTTNNYWSVENF